MKIIEPSFEILEYTPNLTKILELGGRTCYKSEDKICEGSDVEFIEKLKSFKHESVLEHGSITVRFITDRGVTHELVRHRVASFSQESTRYCVAGSSKLTTKNPHHSLTIAELFDKKIQTNSAWKRIKIKQYNESTKLLEYSTIHDIFHIGIKPVLLIKTKLGYVIECTRDHEIYTNKGYVPASELNIGALIAVNGTYELYQNYEWLFEHYINKNKTVKSIVSEFGFNPSTIKKWIAKLNIPKKPMSYWNIGKTPWNKGLSESDHRVKLQIDALREYHWNEGGYTNKSKRERIYKNSKSTYAKYVEDKCKVCGYDSGLLVHHIDENREHNDPVNLITLCNSCHISLHNKNLQTVYFDEICEIVEAGEQDVYDISMNSEHKNFVANGVVVHNCNYGKGKYGSEITVIKPHFWEKDSIKYKLWLMSIRNSEEYYMGLLKEGASAQEARSVLPNSLKTEIIMTANPREWRHVFTTRTHRDAHPQIRQIMCPLLVEFRKRWPILFEDVGNTEHPSPAYNAAMPEVA